MNCCKLSHTCTVVEHPDHLTLFRQYVSNTSEGTERAILEGVGLDTRAIRECFKDNPQDVVQSGLTRWSLGEGFPATWEVLLEAMECARIGQEHIQGLKKNLGQYGAYVCCFVLYVCVRACVHTYCACVSMNRRNC